MILPWSLMGAGSILRPLGPRKKAEHNMGLACVDILEFIGIRTRNHRATHLCATTGYARGSSCAPTPQLQLYDASHAQVSAKQSAVCCCSMQQRCARLIIGKCSCSGFAFPCSSDALRLRDCLWRPSRRWPRRRRGGGGFLLACWGAGAKHGPWGPWGMGSEAAGCHSDGSSDGSEAVSPLRGSHGQWCGEWGQKSRQQL